MKFNFEIENLLKVTGDIQWLNGIPFVPPSPNPDPKQEPPITPAPKPNITEYAKFEDFGADSFYEEFTEGIHIKGNRVISNGLFTREYIGKTFCGIFSHKNPADSELYYPAMISSRYANVTEFISSDELELDFSFNIDSGKGYFFYDNSEAFKKALESNAEVITSDGVYIIPEYRQIERKKDLIFKGKGMLIIGYECYFQWAKNKKINQSKYLIHSNSDVNIVFNCNIAGPFTTIQETDLFNRSLFLGDSGSKTQKAIFGLVDSKVPAISPFGTPWKGWGLGMTYSGLDVYNLVKNVESHTNLFIAPKSNNAYGDIAMVLHDVDLNETPKKLLNESLLVKGIIGTDNVFRITSDNTVYQIYNLYMWPQQWGNGEQILFIDRFTLPLRSKNIIDSKSFKVDIPEENNSYSCKYLNGGLMAEFNAGDILEINSFRYTVISKDRAAHPYYLENEYTSYCVLDKPLQEGLTYDVKIISASIKPIIGVELKAYMIYKSNANWKSTVNTKFNDQTILFVPDDRAVFYTHKQVNIWAENVRNDFYRQSSGVGKQKYCNLVNVESTDPKNTNPHFGNQFSAESEITTDMPMPPKIVSLLSRLNEI